MTARPKLSRDAALAARPERVPTLRRDDRDDGGVKVTVRLTRRPWFGLFGREVQVEQTFGLDAFGREVYEACDGAANVKRIIRGFQERHRVGRSEAEVAVTTFLQTLMKKGLVVMAVDKDKVRT